MSIRAKEELAAPSGSGETVEPAAPHTTPAQNDSRKRSRAAGEGGPQAVPEQQADHGDAPAAKRIDAKDQVG